MNVIATARLWRGVRQLDVPQRCDSDSDTDGGGIGDNQGDGGGGGDVSEALI